MFVMVGKIQLVDLNGNIMSEYKLNSENVLGKRMLMIEHDAGYIDPNDERNKHFVNEIKKVSSGSIPMIEPLIVTVVLQKWGVKNRNGRIYPEGILKSQANVYNELIKNKSALGESDHPESSIISIDRVSHNRGFIEMGICSTKGDEVANLLRLGWRIGVSSRGVGTLEENYEGDSIVQDDFELIGWDIVTTPSTPGSWIFANSNEAKPFTESVEKNDGLNDALDNFLLD
jgi:hypothetical protein